LQGFYEIIQQNGEKIVIDNATSPLKYQTPSKLFLETSVSIGGYGRIASVVAWRLGREQVHEGNAILTSNNKLVQEGAVSCHPA
jgi:hypothetical protein